MKIKLTFLFLVTFIVSIGQLNISVNFSDIFSADTLNPSGEINTINVTQSIELAHANHQNSSQIRLTGLEITFTLDACFEEGFDGLSGNNTTNGGSNTAWNGNANFPTVDRAFQAGDAVRLGASSAIGSVESKVLADVSGDVTVNIRVKGWTNVEGDLKVSMDGQEQTLSYTAKMADDFEEIAALFTGVTPGSTLKIETTAKRAFIDRVEIMCDDSPSSNEHFKSIQSGNWTSNSTWESSEDGSTWTPSATYPKSTAISVTIQPAHKVNLNTSGIQITNTEVYGSLEVGNTNFSVVGDENIELKIKEGGKFIVNGSGISTGKKALIETGGALEVIKYNAGTDFVKNYIDAKAGNNSLFIFEDQSIFDWNFNGTSTMGSANYLSIFNMGQSGDLVIFRLIKDFAKPNSAYGSGTNNTFNAVLEVMDSKSFNITGDGNKTFKGGIRGTGELTITHSGTGKLIFGDASTVPVLGSNGELQLNISSTRIEFPNGANLPSTATVILNNPTLNSTITRSGGIMTIDGTLDLTLMRITNANTGSINVNGTIRTAHSGGLYGTSAAIPSGSLLLNPGNTVEYYGSTQQISNLDYYHLILSGSGVKTPQNFTKIDSNGSVTITGNPTVDFREHNLASTADNNTKFTMDGGRLILGKTGTQPNMKGTYNLTGGVIEFANSQATAQTIRSSSDYFYKNIEISGAHVGNSSGNINLHTNGSFTVKSGGVFNISLRSIKCETTDQCAVNVESGAVFRTGNNKGFNGFDNGGGIGVDDSAIHSNISAITLADDSTVDYFNDNILQQVSEFTPGYSNLKVSGKAFIDGNILVKNITSVTSTGELTIKETMQEQPSSHVLYANKGVEVESEGKLILENNSVLMQDDDAVNVGDIQVHRTFTFSDERNQYNFIISPVKGQSIKSIYTGAPFVIYHREDKNFFYNAGIGAYDPLNPAKGFAIKEASGTNYPSNTVNAQMKGEPFNGLASFPLTYTTSNPDPVYIPGYNLVGNPYPSNLDIEQLYDDNSSKIDATFQFWDNRGNTLYEQQGSSYGGAHYAKYNAENGTGIGSGEEAPEASNDSGVRIPTRYVRPGTAFMIRALEDANGKTLDFKNEYRVAANNSPEFFGKDSNESKNPSRYWLTMHTPSGIEYMTAVVYFWNGSNDFTLDDSEANGSSDDIYTLIGEEQIAIQGRAPFVKTDKVPLGVRLFEMGTYVISLYDKEGVFANGQNIYIRDKKLKTIYNLTQADYKFIEDAGGFNDRFEIIYNPNSLTSDNAS
ncbi:MAG: hypothetical protein WCY77_12120, partial [Weeksellaceae bacterium]